MKVWDKTGWIFYGWTYDTSDGASAIGVTGKIEMGVQLRGPKPAVRTKENVRAFPEDPDMGDQVIPHCLPSR